MGTFLRQLALVALALLAMLASLPVRSQYASDIDIYSAVPTGGDLPNVLVVIDNSANWNPVFAAEKAALRSTFASLPAGRFRLGLMMFTQSGESPEGGFVLAGIRELNTDYRARIADLVQQFANEVPAQGGHKGNAATAGLAMAEAYFYFSGGRPYAGVGAAKADVAGNTQGNAAEDAIHALAGNPLASRSASAYNNSFALGNCAPNYVIYLSNGPAQDSHSSTVKAEEFLRSASGDGRVNAASIAIPGVPTSRSVADEWARFMKQSPQRIVTYTIDVMGRNATQGQGDEWTAHLKSMANVSGGEYFPVDAARSDADVGASIQRALFDILNQIQAANSVFSSASLPVSGNARGTYLNQVFMGMFRPDGDSRPRWRGNLKQFRFAYDPTSDTLSLVDANGKPAVSGATGFISPSATSYWSHSSEFWRNQLLGTPPSASDAPDGEVVEKGGAAQQLREAYATDQSGRRLLTCVGCASGTNLATNASTNIDSVAASALGVSSESERGALIAWIRGRDNAGDEQGPGGSTTVRPSVHGDVLHSRPAVVNYGDPTGVVVFYGGNDGLLRAVNGNQTGAGAGEELWGFVPQEHLSKFKRLRANSPPLRLSTTLVPEPTTDSSPRPRDYFVDGPIGVYQKVNASGVSEKVHIYSAMRRGGRQLYALDVSNPRQPVFLWKHTEASLPILGQTWSEPKVARLRGHANPVIVMGAGYDNAAEDVSPPGTTTMGTAVLVLDAFDGTLLKQFDTLRSVAADVALIDADYDGFVDRAYAVDVGGSVYRIDFETTASAAKEQWSSYRMADLGASGSERARKFFFPPDVVLTRSYAALLLASGDREKPLDTVSNDRFFTLYDRQLGKAGAERPALLQASELGQVGAEGARFDKGCYVALDPAGEKAVNAPVTAAGITYFSTNKPVPRSANSCDANLGQARVYAMPLFCKAGSSQVLSGGGLPPSPVVGVVTVSYTSQETGQPVSKEVPFIIGAPNAKNSAIEGSKVKPSIVPTRKRKFWYLENAR